MHQVKQWVKAKTPFIFAWRCNVGCQFKLVCRCMGLSSCHQLEPTIIAHLHWCNSATDTIRTMRQQVDSMDATMAQLAQTMQATQSLR
jgi:hypothetical protein